LCDFDRSDDKLTQILHETCPSQLPQHFQIEPLPIKISLWLTLLLLKISVKEQLWEAHETMLGHGTISPSTLDPSVSAMTSSSTTSQDPNKRRSASPLPWFSGRDDFQDQLMTLASGTIQNTILDICATFRENS
jgi:hypothetical protein